MSAIEMHRHYKNISKAIEYLSENITFQPDLSDISKHVGISEFHLQRLFSHWVGISPKQFLMVLTQEYAKSQLEKSSVLQSSLACGLSSASRLHDIMIKCDGITPGEYKKKGYGLKISYGVHETPFSLCLIASTERGVCKLAFFDDLCESETYIDELKHDWPNASFCLDQLLTQHIIDRIFTPNTLVKAEGDISINTKPLRLFLKGTPFQLKVWQALLSIPQGELCSYQQLADVMGVSTSVRAVASAIAKNNIGYLIPCHRVIKSTGALNAYRWGALRKKVIQQVVSDCVICLVRDIKRMLIY